VEISAAAAELLTCRLLHVLSDLRAVLDFVAIIIIIIVYYAEAAENIQVAQLSQRDRAAGWVSNGQKWKTGTERQYLRTI